MIYFCVFLYFSACLCCLSNFSCTLILSSLLCLSSLRVPFHLSDRLGCKFNSNICFQSSMLAPPQSEKIIDILGVRFLSHWFNDSVTANKASAGLLDHPTSMHGSMTGTSDSDESNIGKIDDGADPESLKMRDYAPDRPILGRHTRWIPHEVPSGFFHTAAGALKGTDRDADGG